MSTYPGAPLLGLFAGVGWDYGLRMLGQPDSHGIDFDATVCATRTAAGMPTTHGDVSAVDPLRFRGTVGLTASPPCPTFSRAGRQSGVAEIGQVIADVDTIARHGTAALSRDAHTYADPRTQLVLQPLIWALLLEPEWLAFEQVPSVLPIWEAMGWALHRHGWSFDAGVLTSEAHGVPQVRKRAVLVAHRNRAAYLPAPTHHAYHYRETTEAALFGPDDVRPYVTMAQAVGWGYTKRPAPALVATSDGGRRLLDGGSGAWQQVLAARERGEWVRRPDRLDHPFNRGEVSTCSTADGARLQSFPADVPWAGGVTAQGKQIGNAMPPVLAREVLSGLIL